jgi:hypothetical protein
MNSDAMSYIYLGRVDQRTLIHRPTRGALNLRPPTEDILINTRHSRAFNHHSLVTEGLARSRWLNIHEATQGYE